MFELLTFVIASISYLNNKKFADILHPRVKLNKISYFIFGYKFHHFSNILISVYNNSF